MTSVVQTRQELYLRLFHGIWDPEGLGFPRAVQTQDEGAEEPVQQVRQTQTQTQTQTRRKAGARRRRTDVARMLDADVLKAGTQIVLTYRSVDHWAAIDEDGGIILTATGGTPYGRVHEAGAVVRGTKTCQGMNEWHVEDATGERVSLRTLRDRAMATGVL